MSRSLFHISLLVWFFTMTICTGTSPLFAGNDYVPGEIIVRYKADVSGSAVVRSLSAKGATRLGGVDGLNVHFVALPSDGSVEKTLDEYRKDPDVLYAEPNYRVHALQQNFPNEKNYVPLQWDEQWGLHNTGQDVGPSNTNGAIDADIDAPEAWEIETGSSDTVIAVLDTGMDLDHEDLSSRLWTNSGETASNSKDDDGNGYIDDENGWDFVNNDNDPDDDNVRSGSNVNSHGTHISGIIGAQGDNLKGVAGINWNVKLMILKVLDQNGEGTVADIITAIQYAVNKQVKIINASWGVTSFSQSLYDEIKSAGESGALITTAAGNTGTVEYPARFNLDNIIAVTATGLSDELTDFGTGTNAAVGVEDVDLGAPGRLIYSTIIMDNGPSNESYYWKDGTSQATAFVTGVAGLLLSDDSTLTPAKIKGRILNKVEVVSDLANTTVSGGRLDAFKALSSQVVIVPFGTGLNVGETKQFTLDGATATNWSSSNTSVGTINASGLFTAVAAGTCTVSASSGLYTSATIYVKEITITSSKTSLDPVENVTFTASGGTSPYTWTSTDTSVLTVNSSGIVTGVAKGSATVTATDARGYSGTSETITVSGSGSSGGGGGGNCFIATAAFGSPLERHVRTLQEFRDRCLMTNGPGRAFVRLYYQYSPPLAERIADSPLLRGMVRILLIPLILFGAVMVKSGISWKGLFFAVMLIAAGTVFVFQKRRNMAEEIRNQRSRIKNSDQEETWES
ncbi:MAG: S8 family serine peptidase [bacterium]